MLGAYALQFNTRLAMYQRHGLIVSARLHHEGCNPQQSKEASDRRPGAARHPRSHVARADGQLSGSPTYAHMLNSVLRHLWPPPIHRLDLWRCTGSFHGSRVAAHPGFLIGAHAGLLTEQGAAGLAAHQALQPRGLAVCVHRRQRVGVRFHGDGCRGRCSRSLCPAERHTSEDPRHSRAVNSRGDALIWSSETKTSLWIWHFECAHLRY